ncbi:OmpA family protein [Vibrio porteresiae]|uniref:OmpA family protein n=1 Tax=Vibrio porteresiae DSM 19223 TaxID=1123496 RepID=A0ABZ0QHI5_9VIBR|nr:OmpA family protein [Vibrio porteresiae]WPC75662.1 OmpA family protein [Vibrio porteresiae DSM 19223]
MKYVSLFLTLFLSACSSSGTFDKLLGGNNKLDVAPKDDVLVRNPDWGVVKSDSPANSTPVIRSNYAQLVQFLSNQGIDYQVIPGKSMMVYVEDTIRFHTNSDKVAPASYPWMTNLSYFLAHHPAITIVVNGHTDTTGTYRLNDSLSERRAKSIERMLRQMQVPKDSIYTRGYGEYLPECTNKTSTGRACNRRVELLFIVDEG